MFEDIANRILEEMAKEAVIKVIKQNQGSNLAKPIRDAIIKRATDMLENDEELQDLMKATLVFWIDRPAAENEKIEEKAGVPECSTPTAATTA